MNIILFLVLNLMFDREMVLFKLTKLKNIIKKNTYQKEKKKKIEKRIDVKFWAMRDSLKMRNSP